MTVFTPSQIGQVLLSNASLIDSISEISICSLGIKYASAPSFQRAMEGELGGTSGKYSLIFAVASLSCPANTVNNDPVYALPL